MKLRKLVAMICCLSLAVGMLTGCGGSSNEPDTSDEANTSSEEAGTSSESNDSDEVSDSAEASDSAEVDDSSEASDASALNGTITIWEQIGRASCRERV